MDETRNISVGPQDALRKNFREIAPGIPPKGAKMCFVFCHQYNAAFRTLILHQFRPYLKQQTQIAVPEHISVRNFQISA